MKHHAKAGVRRTVTFLGDTVSQYLYWRIPGFRQLIHSYFNRPAGFNPTVDEQRELSIMLKLARGQWFLTADDGRFLMQKLKEARNPQGSDSNEGES